MIRGFRADYEGEVYAYCRVIVHGEEREVTLPNGWNRHYTVGQQVTVYPDPVTGDIHAVHSKRDGSASV